jgi:GTP cyclohydrolase FolE2
MSNEMHQAGIPDVHKAKPLYSLAVNDVCVKGLKVRLCNVAEKDSKCIVADVLSCIDLDAEVRGVHISRIVGITLSNLRRVTYRTLLDLQKVVEEACKELLSSHNNSSKAYIRLNLRDVVEEDNTPLTLSIAVRVSKVNGSRFSIRVGVEGMTVCPCAQQVYAYMENLSLPHAPSHTQRASIMLNIGSSTPIDVDVKELVTILRNSFSAPVQNLLKRVDEYKLIRKAFENPKFAEDVAREALYNIYKVLRKRLSDDARMQIKVISFESIHPFNLLVHINHTVKSLDKLFLERETKA